MSESSLESQLLGRLLADRPSLERGMLLAFDLVSERPRGRLWAPCSPHIQRHTSGLLRKWTSWLDALISSQPIPPDVEVLWFEVPDGSNDASTSVAAYARLGPKNDSFGANGNIVWPLPDRSKSAEHPDILDFPELDQLLTHAGWPDDEDRFDELATHIRVPFLAAVALLALNGLPKVPAIRQLAGRSLGLSVLISGKAGDVDAIGTLTANGWQPIRRPISQRKPKPINPDLSIRRDFDLRPRSYLKAGGDPNKIDENGNPVLFATVFYSEPDFRALQKAGANFKAVNAKGESALHYHWYSNVPELDVIVEAGADPNARTSDGMPALFAFASREWKVVKRLIELGADPKSRHGSTTFLDASIGYAGIPIAGLRWLWDRGVRFGGERNPLGSIAACGFHVYGSRKAVDDRIRFCLERGFNMNSPRHNTPLWIALEQRIRSPEWHSNKMAIALLEAGANPNARYQHTENHVDARNDVPSEKPLAVPPRATPLMIPRYDDLRFIKALLRHGANPNLKSGEGLSAIEYAQRASASNPQAARALRLLQDSVAQSLDATHRPRRAR